MNTSFAVRRSSLAQTVYTQLKQLIVRHEIEPGEKIGLADVAKKLGVSLTPLREALARLTEEGVVVHRTHLGYFVAEISVQEAMELYGLREALEGYAIRRGAGQVSVAQLKAIAEAIEVHGHATRGRDLFVEDKVLHLRLAAISGNQLLVRMLEQILDRAIMKLRVSELPRKRGPEAYKEHLEILAALHRRDGKTAVKHLHRHLERTKAYIRAFLSPPEQNAGHNGG